MTSCNNLPGVGLEGIPLISEENEGMDSCQIKELYGFVQVSKKEERYNLGVTHDSCGQLTFCSVCHGVWGGTQCWKSFAMGFVKVLSVGNLSMQNALAFVVGDLSMQYA